jgi:hypothetical protein
MAEQYLAVNPSSAAPETTHVADDEPRRGGFALLSVIVAVIMIATGVMALAAANTTRMRYQTTSTSRAVALNIARDYHEEVRARNPFTLADEPEARVDAGGFAVSNGEYTREMKVTVTRANLLTLEIIVGVPRNGVPVRLLTNIYRGVKLSPRT